MDRLGPFEPSPLLAVAASGGADSTALAMLVRDWVHARDGKVAALIVDHGLRPESAQEARATQERLAAQGISADILPVTGLRHGPALADRARDARYQTLLAACRAMGVRHLLLGHHAGDQVETVAMRVLRGSRNDGLSGMSAVRHVRGIRLLRPLLNVHPSRLRAWLMARGIAWAEDPSNRDMRTLRARLRTGLARGSWDALLSAVALAGVRRSHEETMAAEAVARHVTLYPEGYGLVAPGRLPPAALSSVLTAIGGAGYPPDPDLVAGLSAHLAPATLHGVRIMPGGRLGDGWLVVREEAAVQAEVPALPDVVWDRRFAVSCPDGVPDGMTIGKLGDDAAGFRRLSRLPSAVLRTLPALRIGKKLAAVPHLRYESGSITLMITVTFEPPHPVDSPVFMPQVSGFLGGIDQSSGCDSPRLGEPSSDGGMQLCVTHTIYDHAAPGTPDPTTARCPNPIEDVSKVI
jgi:tRNA(Ile)-lysidine synthase